MYDYRTMSFPVTLNDHNPAFKVTVLFKGEYYSKQCILYRPTVEDNSFT